MQTHLEVIQMFDIDLSKGRSLPRLDRVFPEQPNSQTFSLLEKSFDWLFDAQEDLEIKDESGQNPDVHYLSQQVNSANTLPRFDRYSLRADAALSWDKGGAITISRELRVAVLTTWSRFLPPFYPLKVKHELDTEIPRHYKDQLSGLFLNIAEAERMFPLIAIRYDEPNLSDILAKDKNELAEIFTGGLDHEAEETRLSYLEENLSIRRYEGLFLRLSDALAIYSSGIENHPDEDLSLYETTLFRAAQVCEVCLLTRRTARTFIFHTDRDARKVRLFPRPFLVEKRRSQLLGLEKDIIKFLPFRSPEAPALVRNAQLKFEVDQLLEEAKDSYNFLETRYQNTKTTALAILGILTYILEKLHFWDWISPFQHSK